MPKDELFRTLVWAGVAMGVVAGLTIAAVVSWLMAGWLRRIPPEHRRIEEWKIWLQLVPVFNVAWVFFVYPPMAESFASYFRSKGSDPPPARGLAWAYCLATAAQVPFTVAQLLLNPFYRGEPIGPPTPLLLGLQLAGGLVGMGVLVLWVLVLMRFHELQKQIPAPAA